MAKLAQEVQGREVRQVVKRDFAGFEGEGAADNEY